MKLQLEVDLNQRAPWSKGDTGTLSLSYAQVSASMATLVADFATLGGSANEQAYLATLGAVDAYDTLTSRAKLVSAPCWPLPVRRHKDVLIDQVFCQAARS